MIYGRVIGNELRDVPPECLPIWGQRWSGYRAPHGPSPFSTRIFSVDRMSEMGPALTSPTQFEVTFTEEDEEEDTNSESSRLYSTFTSSPSAIQTDVTELTSRPETPTPRSDHRSSSHLYHETPIQGGRVSFENDYTLWDMDRTSTSIQPRAGPSYGSHIPTAQLQYTMPSHSTPQWQFANAYTQSSAYPFQPNPSSHPGNGYLLQPFQADDRTRFIPTTPPSSSHSFITPLPQQNVGIDSSWNHESSITMIPGIAYPRNPMISQWPSGSVPLNPSFSGPLQNSGSSLGPGVFYHLVSDHHRDSSHPEDLLGTFADPEGCTLLSLDKPGGDQFIR